MSVIILENSDEYYLRKCALDSKNDKVVVGIIIGQKLKEEYFVVHLAQNRDEDADIDLVDTRSSRGTVTEETAQVLFNFTNINTHFLASQWMNAIRMIPGSFTVLGFFVCAKNVEMIEQTFREIARKVFNEIHALLQTKSLEIHKLPEDYLLLAFSLNTNQTICWSYPHNGNTKTFKTIECKFSREPFQWQMFSCCYELNDVFPIRETRNEICIEKQFHDSVAAVCQSIQASDILIQNERVNDETTVEAYFKERFVKNKGEVKQELQQLNATVYLPVEWRCNEDTNKIRVKLFGGTIRYLGGISSRVYCNPRNTFKDVKGYIRCDIIRSLIARIQVYCDGLTENKIKREAILISHPPRRVYFNLSTTEKSSQIQFSEYVFKNETTALVITQVQQILDFDLKKIDIIDDLETSFIHEDLSDIHPGPHQQPLSNEQTGTQDLTRSMFTLGLVVSLLVLLLSVCLNSFLKL